MSQQQFTAEELEQIKELQTTYNEIGIELVQIKLAQKNAKEYIEKLNEQEEELTKKIVEANQSEKLLAEKLNGKYGAGSLDVETGLFTPTTA